jgi:hypothetical protein
MMETETVSETFEICSYLTWLVLRGGEKKNPLHLYSMRTWNIILTDFTGPFDFGPEAPDVGVSGIDSLLAKFEIYIGRSFFRGRLTQHMVFFTKKNIYVYIIIITVICQTTGPKPLLKRFLHLMRSRD